MTANTTTHTPAPAYAQPFGHWMLTAGGREYVLSGPGAMNGNAPDLKDIAHHLAQINRFTGACRRPYSVGEHSLLVERIGRQRGASPMLRLALLMHDAHEAYTNDMASPAKRAIGMDWTIFEGEHATNVRHHFGLRTIFAAHAREVSACDLIALATERRDLTAYEPGVHTPWPALDTPGLEVHPSSNEWLDPAHTPDWQVVRVAFISKYLELRELASQQLPQTTGSAA